MRKFLVGLSIGAVIASFGVMIEMAAAAPEQAELKLPEVPEVDADGLTEFLERQPYEIGYCAKNLVTGEELERYGDRSVCLASMVKVFCLTELFRQKHADGLDLSREIEVAGQGGISLMRAAELMIGKSDNPSTQALADFLGRKRVNAIPKLLGIKSMSAEILPTTEDLQEVLDKRITGKRVARRRLPMHGSARGMMEFYEKLAANEVISGEVSADLREFFGRHPKPFSKVHAGQYRFGGKGGNILWTRPPKHYSMMGWGLLLAGEGGEKIAVCVWGEWFPEEMGPDAQSEFLKYVTDSVIGIVAKK